MLPVEFSWDLRGLGDCRELTWAPATIPPGSYLKAGSGLIMSQDQIEMSCCSNMNSRIPAEVKTRHRCEN
jgi:hypothetical protein